MVLTLLKTLKAQINHLLVTPSINKNYSLVINLGLVYTRLLEYLKSDELKNSPLQDLLTIEDINYPLQLLSQTSCDINR